MKKFLIVLFALALMAGSALAAGPWTANAVLTAATDNTVSAAVALPSAAVSVSQSTIDKLWIYVPTITSSTVYIQVSGDGGTTYADFRSFNNGTNMVLGSTAAGTGGMIWEVPGNVGGFTHVKVKCGSEQAANRTFVLFGK